MSRDFTSAQNTALQAQNVNLLMFARLEFPSGTIYVHNGLGTYTWGSTTYGIATTQNWDGVGDLGSVSTVEEGLGVSPYAITLQLSGLDSTISGAALTEDYFMRGVTVFLGLLNDSDVLIDTPVQVWAGFMDQMNITVGKDGGDTIELIAESELSRFDKSSDLMYTNASQQQRFSGDLAFNYMHVIEGQKIKWGSPNGGSGPADNPQTPGDIKEANEMGR